ncbi:hypothetical protein ABZ816_23440 [Actinosynnema sp. NPDC047251]|uniref:Uncharacterized protein n=1 Tax=Saccharothrix espanaensis (strain ATCC 51144 / DSM 44229 / JCM 9112 / NBRC 15066 / NRRL 15764) TaxID=1179773 RepID=K0K7I9_SACES|nr:hypothetical protein [Saccharothrix espanaensis]CCH32578.1 hypothetical protein BN6_53140 [Saccharothrix espanaensis DSM 44229]
MSSADLPQSGSKSELRCRASEVEFTLRSKPVLVDFAGTCSFTADTDAQGTARFRLTGLRLTAELPDAGGPEDGGTITLVQDEDSVLRSSTESPSHFADDLVIALGATVEQPGGKVQATVRNPAKFSTAGASCPSGSGHYELVEPIDLILPDSPEVTIAQIHSLVLHADPA